MSTMSPQQGNESPDETTVPEKATQTEVAVESSPTDITESPALEETFVGEELTVDTLTEENNESENSEEELSPKRKRTPLTVPKAVNIALIVIIVISFSIVFFFLPKLFS